MFITICYIIIIIIICKILQMFSYHLGVSENFSTIYKENYLYKICLVRDSTYLVCSTFFSIRFFGEKFMKMTPTWLD